MASEPPPVQRSSARDTALGSPVSVFSSANVRHQEFADEAPRHDDALVDIERHALDIGAVQEIGGRLSRRHARFDQRVEPFALASEQLGVEKRVDLVDRELQPLEDEIGGLVERRGRAMSKGEAGGAKAADGVA